MTVTAKGLDGSSGSIRSGEGVEEEDTSAGFVKSCPIVLKNAKKASFLRTFSTFNLRNRTNLQSIKVI